MSDAIPSSRPHHSRSSSISKTARTNSHQRKPSINSTTSNQLYSIKESQKPATMDSYPSPSSPLPPTFPSKKSTSRTNTSSTLQHYLNLFHCQVDYISNSSSSSSSLPSSSSSSGPLLPQDKHTAAFGGPAKTPTSWLSVLARLTIVQFLLLLYVVFSIFLSLHHLWIWLSSETLDARFGDNWIPQRTYDQDSASSVLDNMTHGLKMLRNLL
ncbi:unnamed protein product [Absidia cylindrospora]